MRRRGISLMALASGLALSACMPMDGGTYASGSYGAAPYPAGLQEFDESADDYAWIDRADALWDAIGDAPPDHAFAFEGAEPWAWVTPEGYTIIVEDATEGVRSFYFEPRDDLPFLASEPGHSFGFADGRLAVAYGPDGGVLAEGGDMAAAMRLQARGRRLKQAMQPAAYATVDSQAWIDASPFLLTFRDEWDAGRVRHPGWRSYSNDARAREWRQRLDSERWRRRAMADSFRRWREGGFQGEAPGRWRRPDDRRPGAGRPARQPGQGRGRPRPRPDTSAPQAPVAQPMRPRPHYDPIGKPRGPGGRASEPVLESAAEPPPPATAPTRRPRPDADASRRDGDRPEWRRSRPQPGTETPPRWQARPGVGQENRRRREGNRAAPRPTTPAATPQPGVDPVPPSAGYGAPPRPRRQEWNRSQSQPRPSYTPAPAYRPQPSPAMPQSRSASAPAPRADPPAPRPTRSRPTPNPKRDRGEVPIDE